MILEELKKVLRRESFDCYTIIIGKKIKETLNKDDFFIKDSYNNYKVLYVTCIIDYVGLVICLEKRN